jgi:hypothetical protein
MNERECGSAASPDEKGRVGGQDGCCSPRMLLSDIAVPKHFVRHPS